MSDPWNDIESEVARRRLEEGLSTETLGGAGGAWRGPGAELFLIGSGADRTRARVFRDQDGNPFATHVHDKTTGGWRKLSGGEFNRVRENFEALRSGAMSLTSVIQGGAQPQEVETGADRRSGAERRRDIESGMAGVQVQQGPPPAMGGLPTPAPKTARDKTLEDWMGIHPASTVSVIELGHGDNKDHLVEGEDALPQPEDGDSGGGVAGGVPLWSFKTTISGSTVNVAGGFRRLEGVGSWSFVGADDFSYIEGGVVYMTRTYPTVQSDGTVNENGAWSGLLYGSPPASDSEKNVIRIAQTVDNVVIHEHLGNISVIDIVHCTGEDDPEEEE